MNNEENTNTNTQLKSSQTFAPMKERNENSSSINNIEQWNGTPFGIITTNADDESNTFVAIGNKRLTPLQPREISEDMIANKDWNLITQLVMHIQENAELIKSINEASRKQGIPN